MLLPIKGHTQGFTLSVTVNDATPTGYCDVTTFTINISNTGGASTFTGRIKFKTLEFRIIDNSELPNLTLLLEIQRGKLILISQHLPFLWETVSRMNIN